MTWRLAIDFGTSNTAAAHRSGGGEAEALPLTHHGNLMPSAVFVGDDGISVGLAAFNRAAAAPAAFVGSPKRFVDTDTVNVDGSPVDVADLVAAVLQQVVTSARRHHADEPPEQVVLTHPEAWSPHARARLVEGATRAGIDPGRLSLVSEPRAAAHFYSHHHPVAPGERVAVFDFGGGTLDVAVLEATPTGFRVVAARGDNSLGGRNLDALLRRWVDEQLEDDAPAVREYLDTRATPGVIQALEHSIRGAKELLSDTSTATITVSTPDGETGLLLTRAEFERIIDVDVSRAVEITQAVLRDAGAGVSTLYLTGGSARIPHVQDRLGAIARVATLDDPKTVVSRGALYAPAEGVGDQAAPAPASDPFAGVMGAAAAGGAGAAAAAGAAGAAGATGADEAARTAGSTRPAGAGSPASPSGGTTPPGPAPRPASTTGTGSGSSQKGVLVALGGVALLVVGALAWGGMQLLGNDSGTEGEGTTSETAGGNVSTGEGSGTSGGGDTSTGGATVDGMPSEAAPVLPTAYLSALDRCSGTSSQSLWAESGPSQTQCFWKDSDAMETRFGSIITQVTADPAQSRGIRDAAAAGGIDSTYQVDTLQEASGDAPLVTVTYGRANPSDYYLAVTYPDSSVSVTGYYLDSKEKAEGLARETGFLR